MAVVLLVVNDCIEFSTNIFKTEGLTDITKAEIPCFAAVALPT